VNEITLYSFTILHIFREMQVFFAESAKGEKTAPISFHLSAPQTLTFQAVWIIATTTEVLVFL